MASAGEGESSYGGGGAGGKFPKRAIRRPQSTPYDRPPSTVIRNHHPSSSGWLSKLLVDPASKFISARAFNFFSNFRKQRRLLLTEAEEEPRDGRQEGVPNICNGPHEQGMDRKGNMSNSCDGSGISELEEMLKQKTFTRSEIARLTELLRSRTVEFPVEDEEKANEGNHSVSKFEEHDVLPKSPLQENMNENNKFQKIIQNPDVSSRVLEEDVASPAELAKAYMGSRQTNVSPSMLVLHSRALKEETRLLNRVPFPSKSSDLSLASKSVLRVGPPENDFTTPRSRGRSAIYNMARTPYSRGTGSTKYAYGGPSSLSSSQSMWEHDGQFGSKQLALKRRNSVLDDDTGSVGAIRRIRQRPNLSYHLGPPSTCGTGVGYSFGQHHTSLTQKPLLIDEVNNKILKEEIGDDSSPNTSYSIVPSQSSEMASKILQHLEKCTPKKKSAESKLVGASNRSPITLTPNMLRGLALRSLEDVDSTKFLQKKENHKLEDSSNACVQLAHGSTSQKENKVEENGFKELEVPLKLSTSSVNGDALVSITNTVPSVKNADSVGSKFAAQPPQKRRAFRMTAHEDSLELDDEIYKNGLVSAPSGEGREELQTSGEPFSTKVITIEKTPAKPEVKIPEESLASKNMIDLKSDGGVVAVEEKTGFDNPASLAPTSTFQQDMPPREPNSAPHLFSSIDKVPSFTVSSRSPSPGLNTGFSPVPGQEISSSLVNDSQLKNLEPDKGDDKNTQKVETICGTSDSSPYAAPSTSTSRNTTLASSKFSNQIFGNGSTSLPSFSSASDGTSIATATSTLNSGPSTSDAAPPSHTALAPIFSFGSSLTPSSPSATFSTATGAETTEINSKAEETFGNSNKPPFDGTSFAMASRGSNPFMFSSSLTSSTGNNQSQGSLPGSGSLSVVSSEMPPATGAALITQSMPFLSGSSGSLPVFGTSGIKSFTTGSSMIGSSVPIAKPFGSGTTALCSSISSSDTNTISSTGGVTSSSHFCSSWQTSKSPVTGLVLSSPSPSTGFSFGASSTSTAGTNNAPMVFGPSAGTSSSSLFSFTSATATTSSSPSLSQSHPMFANTTAFRALGNGGDQMNMEDSMAEDPVHTTTPTIPVFSQPLVAPSPAGFMFGSTAPSPSPSPFQFGGQQNSTTPQNPSPFQASSSLDFSAEGSFSLGSGGGDKSARKIIRVNKNRIRKK